MRPTACVRPGVRGTVGLLAMLAVTGACGAHADTGAPQNPILGSGNASRSGVDESRTLPSLSPAELTQLCNWIITAEGGPGHRTTCPSGVTITIPMASSCMGSLPNISSRCTATVGQLSDCAQAFGADPCNAAGTSACAPVVACTTITADAGS